MTILGIFLNKEMRTGANRRYLELMEALAEKGEAVFVIMNTLLDYTPQFFKKIPLTVPYVRRGFPPASFLFKRECKRRFESDIKPALPARPDCVHIHGDRHLGAALFLCKKLDAPLFYASRLDDIACMRLLRKRGGIRTKELLRSFLYERVCRKREKAIARRARLIAFQGTRDRDAFCLRTGADAAKTVIIPGNIDPARCTAEWEGCNAATSAERIVFPGGFSMAKGLDDMLCAFAAACKKTGAQLHLSVIGRGTESERERAERLAEKLNIKEDISFVGYMNPPFAAFAEFGLVAYPTMQDAFPDTALEALHCGCPVIASDIGDMADILPAECLFEAGNPASCAELIVRCVEDEGFYSHIRALCRERAAAFRFDWGDAWLTAMQNLELRT